MGDLQKSYHPNGQLRYEGEFVNGVPDGLIRHWHENGVLAQEIPTKMGMINGVVREWNAEGKLLGESTLTMGTGVFRQFDQNGQLLGEIPFVNGQMTGCQIVYTEGDEILAQVFHLNNRRVSRKKYLEAYRQYPELLAPPPPMPRGTQRKWAALERKFRQKYAGTAGEPPRANDRKGHDHAGDELCKSLIANDPTAREARSWLQEPGATDRSLGEFRDTRDALKLVNQLYRRGASNVTVIEIDGGADEPQNSGRLIVELPDEPAKRKSIFKLIGHLCEQTGHDAEADSRQRFILVMLD